MNPRVAGMVALAGVIGLCWWWLSRDTPHDLAQPDSTSPPLVASSPPPLPTPAGDIVPSVKTRALPSPEGVDVLPAIPLETGELGWEATIRKTIEDKRVAEPEKGRRLLEAIPTLPAEARDTAAEEAIKRIPNSEYRHAQTALANPATFGTAVGVLFADLMNRPDEIRLPTLLSIARNPEHPYAPNARDNLNFVLRKDLGSDWTGWDAAIRQHLASKE